VVGGGDVRSPEGLSLKRYGGVFLWPPSISLEKTLERGELKPVANWDLLREGPLSTMRTRGVRDEQGKRGRKEKGGAVTGEERIPSLVR